MQKPNKKAALFKAVLTFVGGPAAGAFGVWLIAEAPMIHAAMCSPLGG